jgi:nanoRNase/pAp phosphatase (c-di-AMP/oligoRNAs hydrolase)
MLDQYQQFYEILQNSQNPLILFSKEHNGDNISSGLALHELLKKNGKTCDIVSPNFSLPKNYRFLEAGKTIQDKLENHKKLKISLKTKAHHESTVDHEQTDEHLHIFITPKKGNLSQENLHEFGLEYKHDLIITLNTPDLETLDYLYHENPDLFYKTPIINIDHSTQNEHYGQLNIINIKASSVSEILYDLIENLDSKFLDDITATYLLTGMIEKTKSFKTPSVTPQSLNIASALVAAGANRENIIKNLYQTKTVNTIKLWGKVLTKLNINKDNKIAWASLSDDDFRVTKTSTADLYGVIDELITNISSIEMTVLFYEKNNQKFAIIKAERDMDLQAYFPASSPEAISKSLIKIKLTEEPKKILSKLYSLI